MSSMLFIDTNIYLDFYRYSNDVSLSLLKRVDNNRNIVISTAEVEMEYKKNRQKVILDALGSIKPQNFAQLNIPSFLKESKYKETSLRLTKELNGLADKLVKRTEKLLESPSRYDPVYRILQKLFKEKGDCHLTRGKKMRFEIREKAQKRFTLGYPPRKANDTSIGDSINWEWIIYCAKDCHSDIVIISRDTDYGQHRKEKSFINDWLLQEFKERVGRKRTITLSTRLSEGFKLAGIDVAQEEEQAEELFLRDYDYYVQHLQGQEPELSEIEKSRISWKQLLTKASPEYQRTPVMALLRAMHPISIEGDNVTLSCNYMFHKEKLEQSENGVIAEKIVSDIIGRLCHIQIVCEPVYTLLD